MKEIIFLVVGFFSLIWMVKRNGCRDLFTEKGEKLWEYIRQLCFEMGENNFSAEFLEEKSGVSADIFKNIFSGRTEISLVHLLYLIFTLQMERYHAFAFLSFFGFSKHCLDYCPYNEFNDLIGNYSLMGDQTAKKYVDDIINKAIAIHSNPK